MVALLTTVLFLCSAQNVEAQDVGEWVGLEVTAPPLAISDADDELNPGAGLIVRAPTLSVGELRWTTLEAGLGLFVNNATGENPDVGASFAHLGSRFGGRWAPTRRSFVDVGFGAGVGAVRMTTASGRSAGANGIVLVPRVAWARQTSAHVTVGVSVRGFVAIPLGQATEHDSFGGLVVVGFDVGFGGE